MRKICLSLLLLCITTMCAFAGSNIKFVQGDKKFLRRSSGDALLEIVWDNATYDYEMPLSEKFPRFNKYAESSWSGFVQEFNDESETVQVVKKSNSARYLITITVTNVDQYLKTLSILPGPATRIWGTLTITDRETDEVKVALSFRGVDGGASPSPFESFSDSFEELGEEVADMLK